MTPLRILVVEDNPLNLMLVRDLLEVRGHLVVPAVAASDLEGKKQPPPDLVLMDIMLPQVDGITLMKMLRQEPGWQDVPFVALTAHAMAGDRDRMLAAGFVGYIPKPIATRSFAREVEAIVSREAPPTVTPGA